MSCTINSVPLEERVDNVVTYRTWPSPISLEGFFVSNDEVTELDNISVFPSNLLEVRDVGLVEVGVVDHDVASLVHQLLQGRVVDTSDNAFVDIVSVPRVEYHPADVVSVYSCSVHWVLR